MKGNGRLLKWLPSEINIAYLISAAVFLMVPLILVPANDRSAYFWPRLLWSQFLVFLVWIVIRKALLFSRGKIKSVAEGLWPFIVILVCAYALLSFSMMIIHALLPSSGFLDRLHLVIQVITTGTTVVIAAIALFAAKTVVAKDIPTSAAMKSPAALASGLATQIKRLKLAVNKESSPEIKALGESLIKLHDRINYSLPQFLPNEEKPEYPVIAAEIEIICRKLTQLDYGSPDCEKSCRKMTAKIDNLLSEIGKLA